MPEGKKRKLIPIAAGLIVALLASSIASYWYGFQVAKGAFVGVGDTIPKYLEYTGTGDYVIDNNSTHYFLGNVTTWKWDYIGTNFGHIVEMAAANASDADIFVRRGTYELTSDDGIDITQAGTHIHGSGMDNTHITVASGFADTIIHVQADYVQLNDLHIDGSGQNTAYDGIVEDGSGNGGIIIENVIIENCGRDGIVLGDTDASWEGNWGKLRHFICRNGGRYGVRLTYDGTDTEVHDFLISGHSGTGDAGFYIDADNVRITLGHLWGNEHEMEIAETDGVTGLIISTVGFMDGGDQGTHRVYHSSTYDFRDSTFTGCEWWVAKLAAIGASDGLYLSGDTYNIAIVGNTFRGDNDQLVNHGRYAIYMDASVSNCTIVGNVIRGFTEADPIETSGATGITESANIVNPN